jgi:hypothetical protein
MLIMLAFGAISLEWMAVIAGSSSFSLSRREL